MEAKERETKLDQSIVANQFSKQKGSLGMEAADWLSVYGQVGGHEPYIDKLVDAKALSLVEEAKQRGEVLDSVEVKQQLASDPEFVKQSFAEYQQMLHRAQNQHNLSNGYYTDQNGDPVNPRYGSRGGSSSTSTQTTKVGKPLQKSYKMGESFEAFKNATPHEYVSTNAIRSGNTLYFANGQMITFPEGTDMAKVVKQYADYDMMNNVEQVNQK